MVFSSAQESQLLPTGISMIIIIIMNEDSVWIWRMLLSITQIIWILVPVAGLTFLFFFIVVYSLFRWELLYYLLDWLVNNMLFIRYVTLLMFLDTKYLVYLLSWKYKKNKNTLKKHKAIHKGNKKISFMFFPSHYFDVSFRHFYCHVFQLKIRTSRELPGWKNNIKITKYQW